ncbi:MAG: NAD(P)/FAD-dependent oxidoreductase, partial [Pseudomonadales bacterium]|nr:NAD(P)/FAD-dependent oxidoreductase [Pseudomonadales bacterium]
VVGGGPAGIAAALSSGAAGARTILVDEQAEPGGSLLGDPDVRIDGEAAWTWLARALTELAERDNVTVLSRTTAIGYYHQNMVALAQRMTDHIAAPPEGLPRERLWHVRARTVILAQGTIERPLVFPSNDRPGVMLAGAAKAYLNRYGTLVGVRPVVVTNHNSAWYAAFDLAGAGATVGAIVEEREEVGRALMERAQSLGIHVLTGHTVVQAKGRCRVSAAIVRSVRGSARMTLDCDALLMSGGWTPSVHLFSHSRGTLNWSERVQAFLPDKTIERCLTVGGSNGTTSRAEAMREGSEAGATAASAAGFTATPRMFALEAPEGDEMASARPALLPAPKASKAFVDFQNDVTTRDI